MLKSKSGKPREVPIAPKLHDVLISLSSKRDGLIFDIPEITLRRYFGTALREAKIFGFRFHDLRHTFASHFIMRTGDLPTLQEILGHHSPQMTQRYAHLAKGHLASEMQIFDSAMPISTQFQTRIDTHMDTKGKTGYPDILEKSL